MIIDFNAHFGSYQGIGYHANELWAQLKATGIDVAVASDVGPVFGGERLEQDLPDGLIEFASISPNALIALDQRVKGVRIYPTYQAWDFNGDSMQALMSIAQECELIVQIILRLQDPRVLVPLIMPDALMAGLDGFIGAYGDNRFVISGCTCFEMEGNSGLFRRENVWVDLSHVQHPINSLNRLLNVIDSSHVLFGSNAPIFYPYSGVFRVLHSQISDDVRERILFRNAQNLLGL